jgi:hypothetical protein
MSHNSVATAKWPWAAAFMSGVSPKTTRTYSPTNKKANKKPEQTKNLSPVS